MRMTVALLASLALVSACASGGSVGRGSTTPAPTVPAVQASVEAAPIDGQVLYDQGLVYASQGDYAAAARAFDACIEANPRFAYAYYQAGLAYDKLTRPDLTAIRFETFLRLAPDAPERPQVESILRTMRGR
ncbi:MAG: tetratricopeptide repeat protein [Vicinamibacterales bacterium]